MEVKEAKGRYYIEDDGKIIAKMTYMSGGKNTIIIDHTIVEREYNGQGLGRQMLYKAVEDARAANLKIIPTCSYAKAMFIRDESLRDVLKEE